MEKETGYEIKYAIGDLVKITKIKSGNRGLTFQKGKTYKITGIQSTTKGVYYELENMLYFGASQLASARAVKK